MILQSCSFNLSDWAPPDDSVCSVPGPQLQLDPPWWPQVETQRAVLASGKENSHRLTLKCSDHNVLIRVVFFSHCHHSSTLCTVHSFSHSSSTLCWSLSISTVASLCEHGLRVKWWTRWHLLISQPAVTCNVSLGAGTAGLLGFLFLQWAIKHPALNFLTYSFIVCLWPCRIG